MHRVTNGELSVNRHRFQDKDDQRAGLARQAASLGHSGAGALPHNHADLLQGRHGHHLGLRLHLCEVGRRGRGWALRIEDQATRWAWWAGEIGRPTLLFQSHVLSFQLPNNRLSISCSWIFDEKTKILENICAAFLG